VTIYTIRVIGNVDTRWSDWFDGLTITNVEPGVAVISGDIADQAALHGTLNRVRDLNLALISVAEVDSGRAEPAPQIHPGGQPGNSSGGGSRARRG
jgi:hypothetical protein